MVVRHDQTRANASDGNGGTVQLRRMDGALLQGECQHCKQITYVQSHIGMMLCSACGQPIPHWCWGRLEPVFVPEAGESW